MQNTTHYNQKLKINELNNTTNLVIPGRRPARGGGNGLPHPAVLLSRPRLYRTFAQHAAAYPTVLPLLRPAENRHQMGRLYLQHHRPDIFGCKLYGRSIAGGNPLRAERAD